MVSSAKYLTVSGWEEVRNKTDAEPPFRLFRDEGRTFLQVFTFISLELATYKSQVVNYVIYIKVIT